MAPESPNPEPRLSIETHPISAFNLNANGNNPDFDHPDASDLTPNPELLAELHDHKSITIPGTEQRIGFLDLNRESTERPLVSLLAYSIDTSHKGTQYELEQIALQSGRRVLAYENPSTGLSDRLSAEQRKALKNGDFTPIAQTMLIAMVEQGIHEIDLQGTSMGGRLAAAVAAQAPHFQVLVRSLILVDPAGVEAFSRIDMANRFLVKEGSNAARYAEHVQDPRGQVTLDTTMEAAKGMSKFVRRDPIGNVVRYPAGLRKPTLEADIEAALQANPDLQLHLLTGGASEIAPTASVNELYNTLAKKYGVRAHMIRLAGDTHALGTGAARRVGWHISRLLKD